MVVGSAVGSKAVLVSESAVQAATATPISKLRWETRFFDCFEYSVDASLGRLWPVHGREEFPVK